MCDAILEVYEVEVNADEVCILSDELSGLDVGSGL